MIDGYNNVTEYPGSGEREDLNTARLVGEAASLGVRAAEAESHAFNWGSGGVATLIGEVHGADNGSSIVKGGTKRVVGNLSPKSIPLASYDLSAFAPKGEPTTVDELRAVVLHGDTAMGVVTRRVGDKNGNDTKFSLGLVELGFGAKNPNYEGIKGKCVARVDGLETGSDDTFPYVPPKISTIEFNGVRATFQGGQIMVEPSGDKAEGVTVIDSLYPKSVGATNELVRLLAENTLMWSIDSTDHGKILGVNY